MPLFNLKKPDIAQQKPVEPAKDTGNVYTNIFERKTEKKEDTDLLKGVFAKETKEKNPKENVLGALPELQKKIIGAFDPSKRNLKLIKSVFIGLAIVSLLGIGFFYAELNPDFDLLSSVRGPNTAQKLNNSVEDILAIQTTINEKNYILLSYYLQQLSYYSDTYAQARNGSVPIGDLQQLQNNILLTYENAQAKYKEPIIAGSVPEEKYKTALQDALRKELGQLKKEPQTQAILTQIGTYETAIKLVNNTKIGPFLNKNTDEIQGDLVLDDSKLFALTTEALSILNNEFSVINDLKQNRVVWSSIVNEIEKVTKSVDTLYNTGFFEELGGLQYSAFDFDTNKNTVILSGRARRDDGTTFTLITNLMDALEQSTMFKDVSNRSFSKSGNEAQGYESSFRIEFSLEDMSLT